MDNTDDLTKIGIASRTCSRKTTDEFLAGITDVPLSFVASEDASLFWFEAKDLENRGDFGISSRVITPLSTIHFTYSENVVFFDGFMMLGATERPAVQGKNIYRVVDIKK